MIDPKELRLGNLLTNSKGEMLVTQVNDCPQTYLSPIPLTLDLLRRFGFEQYGGNFWGHKDSRDHSIRIMSGDIFSFGHDQLSPHYYTRMQYAHQLQNLFFALNGEDLTITTLTA